MCFFFFFLMQKSFLWALVSRRSRFQTGTRFFARGSDRNGNVANFCETVRYYEIIKETFISDVPRFLAISDLPTYPVPLYNVPFLELSWTPLPTLIRDVINERSLSRIH